jgi:uncharacterized protein YjbI with pentapeptide repeats
MSDTTSNAYNPPTSLAELLQRYAAGERNFPEMEMSDIDFSSATLDGANFGPFSWFHSANFEGARLRGVSFRDCNVKCANFRRADLTGASFEGAAIEATTWAGAVLDKVSFEGAGFYGIVLDAKDRFPP